MVHSATRSCRKAALREPRRYSGQRQNGGRPRQAPRHFNAERKICGNQNRRQKADQRNVAEAVSDAPAKAANRIQCAGLTFLHERTSTSAAAYSRISKP
jgi:hypothetical protein